MLWAPCALDRSCFHFPHSHLCSQPGILIAARLPLNSYTCSDYHSCFDRCIQCSRACDAGMTAVHSKSVLAACLCDFHPAFHAVIANATKIEQTVTSSERCNQICIHLPFPCCLCRYSAFALAMILSFASVIPIVSICKLAQCAKPSSPASSL